MIDIETIPNKYPVITLCGSTRFKDEFYRVQKELTLKGWIVISVGLFGHSGDTEVLNDGVKEMLDDMHKRKIDLAQAIYVINVGGYVGSSTRSEIAYARAHGKKVFFLERSDEMWEEVIGRVRGIVSADSSLVADMANVSAILHDAFGWWWTGFYTVDKTRNELILGPFQGPVACTNIGFGKGVCGTCWARRESVIVPDVEKFPGHIACSSLSKSEIVVPILSASTDCLGVIDIDSTNLNEFSDRDRQYLEQIAAIVAVLKY